MAPKEQLKLHKSNGPCKLAKITLIRIFCFVTIVVVCPPSRRAERRAVQGVLIEVKSDGMYILASGKDRNYRGRNLFMKINSFIHSKTCTIC